MFSVAPVFRGKDGRIAAVLGLRKDSPRMSLSRILGVREDG
jgi:hypothetical protein